MKHIMKCSKCGNYTLKDTCGKCNGKSYEAKPAKYSPDDKYGKYRRMAKKRLES